MSNVIPKEFTTEEKLIWFEQYPKLVNELKEIILKKYNFIEIDEQSNLYHKCELGLPIYYNYIDGYEKKRIKSFVMIGFGKGGFFTKFQITIQIIVLEIKISDSFFWGKNINKKHEFINFYPLHITPPDIKNDTPLGTTSTYLDYKKTYIDNNIFWFKENYLNKNFELDFDLNVEQFLDDISNIINNFYNNVIIKELEINKNQFINLKNTSKLDLDKDGNGEVDLVDGESFNKLLTKNQNHIIEIDKNYIQKFVKISIYLKTKKSNTQKIFESMNDTKNDKELSELVNLLKNQIHTYDLLVFHSINMVTSLVESDLITFYEIYECFDELGVFNSNWENEVSNQLLDIGDGIKDLMYSIYQMENKIVNSIDNLTYVTQDSFIKLNLSVNNQLSSINSSIKFNSLLTGIQSYQMYKINQNTKRTG
jgi:hypothetical protein